MNTQITVRGFRRLGQVKPVKKGRRVRFNVEGALKRSIIDANNSVYHSGRLFYIQPGKKASLPKELKKGTFVTTGNFLGIVSVKNGQKVVVATHELKKGKEIVHTTMAETGRKVSSFIGDSFTRLRKPRVLTADKLPDSALEPVVIKSSTRPRRK